MTSSNVNGTSSSPTHFQEIMASVNLGTCSSPQMRFAMLQMALAESNKEQANDYMKQIEDTQNEQSRVAKFIEQARSLQEQAKNGKSKYTQMPEDMKAFMTEHELSWDTAENDDLHSADQWSYNIQSLTNYQETLGNDTQTKMVYLQDFMSQYNSYLQGANSAISQAGQVLTNVATGR